MDKAWNILPLEMLDQAAVKVLLDKVFGSNRHKRTANKLRTMHDLLPALSFAVVHAKEGIGNSAGDDKDDNKDANNRTKLVGIIQCWSVALTEPNNKKHPLIMVGPVAVHPAMQNRGIGKAMVTTLLSSLDKENAIALCMIGDAPYYSRYFHFNADSKRQWQLPGPVEAHRLLVRASPENMPPHVGKLSSWHLSQRE